MSLIAKERNNEPSSHRLLTEKVPGTVVLIPVGFCPKAAARLRRGFAVAISTSRVAASDSDCSRSCRAFSSARSRFIFSSSLRSSAVSSSSSSSESSSLLNG